MLRWIQMSQCTHMHANKTMWLFPGFSLNQRRDTRKTANWIWVNCSTNLWECFVPRTHAIHRKTCHTAMAAHILQTKKIVLKIDNMKKSSPPEMKHCQAEHNKIQGGNAFMLSTRFSKPLTIWKPRSDPLGKLWTGTVLQVKVNPNPSMVRVPNSRNRRQIA